MKRLGTGALITVAILGFIASGASQALAQRNVGQAAVAQATMTPEAMPSTPATPAPAPTEMAPAPPPADFGSPPSGTIPILYNDHHVYAKPDVLRQNRVLAALVRGGTVLIPLRSMFEQMGATVSYDAGTRTVDVSKAGADVKVTVGKPEVVINGETRPLDVPPMLYQGTVLVPVRVISEGMGAYVQWLQDQHVVVVRYLPATPPPPAPPPPSTAPAPPPPPAPAAKYHDVYVAGDYIFSPRVYNEFSPGNTGKASYAVRGAFEFNTGPLDWMIAGDYRNWSYPHNCTSTTDPQCLVTNVGGVGQSFVPNFTPRNQEVDARLGLRILQPRIYIAGSYLWQSNNYGYPSMNGWGAGLEKLPDLDHAFSVYGSVYYYPDVQGTLTYLGTPYKLDYHFFKYQVGVNYVIGNGPIFIEAGWLGDTLNRENLNVPASETFNGPYAGLGIKF